MFTSREVAVLHVFAVARRRVVNDRADVSILSDEFWHMAGRQADQVVGDQNLAIAVRPRPYSDRWYFQCGGDFTGNSRRNALEHDREGAGLLSSQGVVPQSLGVALRFIAAHLMDALRP